jgi:hypothetical protein
MANYQRCLAGLCHLWSGPMPNELLCDGSVEDTCEELTYASSFITISLWRCRYYPVACVLGNFTTFYVCLGVVGISLLPMLRGKSRFICSLFALFLYTVRLSASLLRWLVATP